jgi:hypothetical protein|tara:strand:+ start:1952 stop:2278 length:327 start_codon:yes stop_codon:yes gene_type:complete
MSYDINAPYLDSLKYTETYDQGHRYHFAGKCVVTGKEWAVTVPGKELHMYRRGKLIQDAMPSVSTDDREFLITGISPEGWEKKFGRDDFASPTDEDCGYFGYEGLQED